MDVLAGHADELVVRVEHVLQHHIPALIVSHVDAGRVGRGEDFGDGCGLGQLFLPLILIQLAETFAQGFLVLLVGHHFRGNLEEVALALHVGYAGAADEILHLGVVGVEPGELAYAAEGFAAIMVAPHVRTLGASHFLFEICKKNIGFVYFARGGRTCIGMGCTEGQPQEKRDGKFLHRDSRV